MPAIQSLYGLGGPPIGNAYGPGANGPATPPPGGRVSQNGGLYPAGSTALGAANAAQARPATQQATPAISPVTPAVGQAAATAPSPATSATPAQSAPQAPQSLQPGQQGYSNPGAYRQDLGGWNPFQYATDATTNSLAKQFGGTPTQTQSIGDPYGIPPQNSIDFGGGYMGNAGLTQQWFDMYGPQKAQQMLQAGANTAAGSKLGIGTDPSFAGYDAALTSPTTANNVNQFTGLSVNSGALLGLQPNAIGTQPQYTGTAAGIIPGTNIQVGARSAPGQSQAPAGLTGSTGSTGTSAANPYGDTLQTNPLGYTSWVQPGQQTATNGNTNMGYQSSYDPFGQYANSNPNSQNTSNPYGNLLSLLTMLHLTGNGGQ